MRHTLYNNRRSTASPTVSPDDNIPSIGGDPECSRRGGRHNPRPHHVQIIKRENNLPAIGRDHRQSYCCCHRHRRTVAAAMSAERVHVGGVGVCVCGEWRIGERRAWFIQCERFDECE